MIFHCLEFNIRLSKNETRLSSESTWISKTEFSADKEILTSAKKLLYDSKFEFSTSRIPTKFSSESTSDSKSELIEFRLVIVL